MLKYLYSIILAGLLSSCGSPVKSEELTTKQIRINDSLALFQFEEVVFSALDRGDYDFARSQAEIMDMFLDGDSTFLRYYKPMVPFVDSVIGFQKIAKEKLVKKVLASLKVEHDEFADNTFYYDKYKPYYSDNNYVFCYLSQTGEGVPGLRIFLRYSGEDWLFVNNAVVSCDGEKTDLGLNHSTFKRDNSSGSVWEWADLSVDESMVPLIERMSQSDKCVIRFYGDKYHSDHTLGLKEKQGIRDILDAYLVMKDI